MYYNGEYYSDDDIEGMAESIGMAAEDCIWHCADGHILRSEASQAVYRFDERRIGLWTCP